MLGTNDPKTRVGGDINSAIEGFERIVNQAQNAGTIVILVAPPPMRAPIKYDEFEAGSAVAYCQSLTSASLNLAQRLEVKFLDAGSIVAVSSLDGVHLDADSHARLAEALADMIVQVKV